MRAGTLPGVRAIVDTIGHVCAVEASGGRKGHPPGHRPGPLEQGCLRVVRECPHGHSADRSRGRRGDRRALRADTLVIEHDGPVTVITIDRPERRNAVDSVCADQLREAFLDFDRDEARSVAVLTGAQGTFCAGADLKAVAEGDRRPIPDDGPGPMGPTRLTLSKPVIAAVEGYAVAGGLELALWCDLRVAAEDAVFGVFCRRFGVPLCDLGTVRLPRIVGHGRAMDLILTGRACTAPEALAMGLANRVVAPGRALAAAVGLAHRDWPRSPSCAYVQTG